MAIRDVLLTAAGLGLVAAGFALVSVPLGLIVAGASLAALGLFGDL